MGPTWRRSQVNYFHFRKYDQQIGPYCCQYLVNLRLRHTTLESAKLAEVH